MISHLNHEEHEGREDKRYVVIQSVINLLCDSGTGLGGRAMS